MWLRNHWKVSLNYLSPMQILHRSFLFLMCIIGAMLSACVNAQNSRYIPHSLEYLIWMEDTEYDILRHELTYRRDTIIQSMTGETHSWSKRRDTLKELLDLKVTLERINHISEFRSNPIFSLPFPNARINSSMTSLPNASRTYRKDSTDGIHHGIDFYGPYGTPISSISDGVIVRVTRAFDEEGFRNLQRWGSLDEKQRALNLDIYRGNQVWIMAPDRSVTIYSHLRDITPDLQRGEVVKRGQYLGTIGVSGVPNGKNYRNYHLHLEIVVPPHERLKQFPTILQIMLWDWKWKYTPKNELFDSVHSFFS